VKLSCTMVYRRLTDQKHKNPGAGMSASITWDSADGNITHTTSTQLDDNVGESLTVEMEILASGTIIPSYNCISAFHFTDKEDPGYIYAVNNVSWVCASQPVNTWCMYYCFVFVSFSPEIGYVTLGCLLSQIRLSVVCLYAFVHPTQTV